MRVGGSAHSGTFGLMVRADSPIRTIYDIGANTRVAICSLLSTPIYAVLAWLNLGESKIQAKATCSISSNQNLNCNCDTSVYDQVDVGNNEISLSREQNLASQDWGVNLIQLDSWEANLKSIIDGTADVAGVTPENPIVKESAKSDHGIRFLELPAKNDPEGVKRFRRYMPFFQFAPAPPIGVKEIWGVTTMVGTSNLWYRADFDEELSYEMAKWFDEQYPLYKDKGNKLKTYTFDCLRQVIDNALAPVHEGTLRYLKDKGAWIESDDARQKYNLKLLDWYCQAWETALNRAVTLGIPVHSNSREWVQLWGNLKREINIPRYKMMNNSEIIEGLKYLESVGQL